MVFRVRAEFDLTLRDIDGARTTAQETLFTLAAQGVAEGGRVDGDTDAILANGRAVANLLVIRLLGIGASVLPGASIDALQIDAEDVT